MREPGLDLRSFIFRRVVRGFDEAEVEAALQAVAPAYEEARATLAQLQQALADVTAETERLLQGERSVIRLFRSAEEQARIRIGSAHREAARIVEAAEEQARMLVAAAEQERAALDREVAVIQQRRSYVLSALGALIETLETSAPAGTASAVAPSLPAPAPGSPLPPSVEGIIDDVATGSTVSPSESFTERLAHAGAAEPEPDGCLRNRADAGVPDAGAEGEADLAEAVTQQAEVSTTRRLWLRMSSRRAATAAAALVLSTAAVAVPGVPRWRHTVATVPVQADTPATVPTPQADVPEPPSADPLVVRLKSSRPCWVRVTVDGRAESVMLAAGDDIARGAQQKIQLRIGDAAAVALEVNGQPLPPLGRNGQVVDRTFTTDELPR